MTISRRRVSSGFTTKLQHKPGGGENVRSRLSENARKMPEKPSPSLVVLRSCENGIEKVTSSTLVISTTLDCVQIQGFPRFRSSRKSARRRARRVFYNTLQHDAGFAPQGAESVRTNENQANRVGVRQSRPLVLFRPAPRRKAAATSAAPRSGRKSHNADR